jgi:hypothetical protein
MSYEAYTCSAVGCDNKGELASIRVDGIPFKGYLDVDDPSVLDEEDPGPGRSLHSCLR